MKLYRKYGTLILVLILTLAGKTTKAQIFFPEWKTYVEQLDQNEVITASNVRLDIEKHLPLKKYPYLLKVSLTYTSTRPNQLPDPKTWQECDALDEKLVEFLDQQSEYQHAGTFTGGMTRETYYYLKANDGLAQKLEEYRKIFWPELELKIRVQSDPDTKFYRDYIYPDPEHWQGITTKGSLYELLKQGDNLAGKRKVTHEMYFDTWEELKKFNRNLDDLAYNSEGYSDKKLGKPYYIRFSHQSPVSIRAFTTVIKQIKEIATEYNGTYFGWETPVRK